MKKTPALKELVDQLINIPPLAHRRKQLQDHYNLFERGYHPEWVAREHILLLANTTAQWIVGWDQYLTHVPLPQTLMPHLQRHFVHTDPLDSSLLRFTLNDDHGQSGRYTSMRPGRYLKTYFPMLDDEEIRLYTSAFKSFHSVSTTITRDENEILDAYLNGPSSCLSADPKFFPAGHVATYYADSPNLALAIRKDDTGSVISRAIVNTETMRFTKIYGADLITAEVSLNRLGYFRENLLVGGITRWKKSVLDEVIFAPYIDRRDSDPAYLQLNDNQTATIIDRPVNNAYICYADLCPPNLAEIRQFITPSPQYLHLITASLWVRADAPFLTTDQLQTLIRSNPNR